MSEQGRINNQCTQHTYRNCTCPVELEEFLQECESYGSAGPLEVRKLIAIIRKLKAQRDRLLFGEDNDPARMLNPVVVAEKADESIRKIIEGKV